MLPPSDAHDESDGPKEIHDQWSTVHVDGPAAIEHDTRRHAREGTHDSEDIARPIVFCLIEAVIGMAILQLYRDDDAHVPKVESMFAARH